MSVRQILDWHQSKMKHTLMLSFSIHIINIQLLLFDSMVCSFLIIVIIQSKWDSIYVMQ